MAGWRLGVDLVREPWGAWRLVWTRGKTTVDRDAGELWPDVGEILDELILAGRPRRYAAVRYGELTGKNWLTHGDQPPAARHPSQLVREAIGVPLHDLRTLLADLLRRVDPARARNLIATMLGHTSMHAGEEYRAACEDDAAARDWHEMRRTIATKGLAA